jgi:hypothetical protein
MLRCIVDIECFKTCFLWAHTVRYTCVVWCSTRARCAVQWCGVVWCGVLGYAMLKCIHTVHVMHLLCVSGNIRNEQRADIALLTVRTCASPVS